MRRILAATPLDLVDLFFNFKGLEVVELGLVRLKLGVELVFTSLLLRGCQRWSYVVSWTWGTYSLVSFKQDHTTTLVTCRQIVARLVELDGGNDVRCFAVSAHAI